MPRFLKFVVMGFVGLAVAAWLFHPHWLSTAFAVTAIAATPVMAWVNLRRHGGRPSMPTLLVAAGASAVLMWIFYWLDARWYWKGLLLAGLASPLMSLANASLRSDIRAAQSARDVRATELTRQILSGAAPPGGFTLYLRPFATTDRLAAQALPAEVSTDIPVHLDLETVLRRALEPDHPLIGLGHPGDIQDGAGRVSASDAEWRGIVEELMARAARVVMVPLARPSTTWEFSHLVDTGMLDKLILLMPETVGPTPSGVVQYTEQSDRLFDAGVQRYSPAEHTLDMPAEWETACRAAAELHVELPAYAPCGAMMTITSGSGRVKQIVPLPLSTLANKVPTLRLLLDSLSLNGAPNRSTSVIAALRAGLGTQRGRTLEFNFVRAADGYVRWGRIDEAVELLREAARAGRRRRAITTWYLQAISQFVTDAPDLPSTELAAHYQALAQQLPLDPALSRLVQSRS